MANLSIPDVRQIRALDGALILNATAGGSGAVGDWVYLASDGDWEQADGSDSASAEGRGIVVATTSSDTAFADGDGISIATLGPVAGFDSLTPGAVGYTSDDAGKLEDAAGTVTWRGGYALNEQTFFVQPGMAAPTS